jgi:hypothetical protein
MGFEGGALFSRQQDAPETLAVEDAAETAQQWFALGVGGVLMLEVAPLVSLFAQLEATVPLTQPRFELDDGNHVHAVTVGGRMAVGARLFFSN